MPTTLAEFKSRCDADDAPTQFKDELLDFVTSRITNSLPIDFSDKCPICNVGDLVAKGLSKSAFKKPNDRNATAPVVAICDNQDCLFEFNSDSLLNTLS
jgi:hypothetical protein